VSFCGHHIHIVADWHTRSLLSTSGHSVVAIANRKSNKLLIEPCFLSRSASVLPPSSERTNRVSAGIRHRHPIDEQEAAAAGFTPSIASLFVARRCHNRLRKYLPNRDSPLADGNGDDGSAAAAAAAAFTSRAWHARRANWRFSWRPARQPGGQAARRPGNSLTLARTSHASDLRWKLRALYNRPLQVSWWLQLKRSILAESGHMPEGTGLLGDQRMSTQLNECLMSEIATNDSE